MILFCIGFALFYPLSLIDLTGVNSFLVNVGNILGKIFV